MIINVIGSTSTKINKFMIFFNIKNTFIYTIKFVIIVKFENKEKMVLIKLVENFASSSFA